MIINDPFLTQILEQAHNHPFGKPPAPLDFYPSAASAIDGRGGHHGACIRAEYYKRAGVQGRPIDLGSQLIMDAGSELGNVFAKFFMNCNVAVNPNGTEGELQVRFDRVSPAGTHYKISGRIDVVCLGDSNQYIGYEFKTVWSDGKANRVIQGWKGRPEPDMKNVLQTVLYAWYGREHLNILDWRLTYVYVEGRMGRTYHIAVDKEGNVLIDNARAPFTVHDIFRQYDRLADAIEAGKEPDREGKLFYTNDEVVAMALSKQLTKKATEAFEDGRQVLVPWSPCTYCDFIEPCWGKELADAAAAERK